MPQPIADDLRTIPMSPNLGQSLERAHAAAREQSHQFVLLEHLLFALTEDPEASLILQAANVAPDKLGADVSAYLAGLGEEVRSTDGGEARPHTELLRVLQAAASAAQQSKRRQIDGAIVLAAIVGDGKSPAAGLLKTHGMTFEEAIRALQRANTKARLKPLAKASEGASLSAPTETTAPAPGEAISAGPVSTPLPAREASPPAPVAPPEADLDDLVEEPSVSAASAGKASPQVQSADEILAAARARIQRRAAVLSQAPDAPYFSAPPTKEASDLPVARQSAPAVAPTPQAPAFEPASEARSKTDAVSEAMRELLVASGVDGRGPTASPSLLRESLNGAAAALPRETVVPLRPAPLDAPAFTPAPPPSSPGPFQQAAMAEAARVAPGSPGVDRQGPLPPWPGGMAQAPQPHPIAPPPKPVAPLDRRRLTRAAAPLPPTAQPQDLPKRKTGGGPERGPLVEAIPRRMRLGFSTEGEVRIAQERIEQLVQALSGRGAPPHLGDPVVMRALTVRLRTPDGAFFIEPLTPETQWVEANPHNVHVEPLTWRWAITPREAGKNRVVLLVSMRTIDLDGASEEVGPPDRIVEIKVKGRWLRAALWRLVWVGLFGAVFAAGRYGADVGPLLLRTLRQVTGL